MAKRRRTAKIIPITRGARIRRDRIHYPTLAAIDAEWLAIHRETFRNGWLVRVVRIRVEVPFAEPVRIVASLPNARGQYRPAAEWDAEVESTVEVEARVRIQLRVGPGRQRGQKEVRRAA
jgi:hypothetical protein